MTPETGAELAPAAEFVQICHVPRASDFEAKPSDGVGALVHEDERLVITPAKDLPTDLVCESVAVTATIGQILDLSLRPGLPKSDGQKSAEAVVEGFRQGLGPFVVAAEQTRMPMVFTDAKSADGAIIFANDSFLEMTGYDRDEIMGVGLSALMQAEPTPEFALKFNESPSAASEILCRRKGGGSFWSALFVTPVRDATGALVQHFACMVDLSTHKQEEASRMLIDELNHRVKNTLATVRSIVSQGLRASDDVEGMRESIDSRIFSLSRSHDLLAYEDWTSAGLFDLAVAAMQPFEGEATKRIALSGDNVRVAPSAALALGIALHELATNAVKYGSLSAVEGSVTIDWSIEPSLQGERLKLSWRENGGPTVVRPTRKGFGSRVLERGLAHELAAITALDYRPEGLVCTIDIPAPVPM